MALTYLIGQHRAANDKHIAFRPPFRAPGYLPEHDKAMLEEIAV